MVVALYATAAATVLLFFLPDVPLALARADAGRRTMTMHDDRHWLDEPRNVKRLWRGFLVVLALTVLAECGRAAAPALRDRAVFGFSAWFGFARLRRDDRGRQGARRCCSSAPTATTAGRDD